MADFGITISAPHVQAGEAKGKDVFLTASKPFEKLDSQNPISFQNISLFFGHDTPNPASGASNSTLVYQFAHGYNYVPRFWALIKNTSASPLHLYGSDVDTPLAQATPRDTADLVMTVDATHVNFYVNKSNGTGAVPSIVSLSVQIRCYVFVDTIPTS